ncbi:MAG: threo-3-hydroxy-L-aspartate ammonia-lyase [Pseudomonadota bacterium]
MPDLGPPVFSDVLAAAARIQGVAQHTPVLSSAHIDGRFGASIFFKCETAQHIGAFKFRGAYNALAQLTEGQRLAGVAAYSSGNHAQAIALAARLLGIQATIVMPHDAPAMKVAATLRLGGKVIRYNRYTEDRAAICQALADEYGMAVIPPFDHPHVIAGQGTAALELFNEVGNLDFLFMPLGGGGLLAGSLLVSEARQPACRVYGVEPLNGNDGQQSLRAGRRIKIDTPVTIADGAQTQQLGALTFPIIQRSVADILAVTDIALVDSMRLLGDVLGLITEPTGCLGLAGAASMRTGIADKRVGVILSGGNVEAAQYAQLIGGAAAG